MLRRAQQLVAEVIFHSEYIQIHMSRFSSLRSFHRPRGKLLACSKFASPTVLMHCRKYNCEDNFLFEFEVKSARQHTKRQQQQQRHRNTCVHDLFVLNDVMRVVPFYSFSFFQVICLLICIPIYHVFSYKTSIVTVLSLFDSTKLVKSRTEMKN